jgi:hypothetical protein
LEFVKSALSKYSTNKPFPVLRMGKPGLGGGGRGVGGGVRIGSGAAIGFGIRFGAAMGVNGVGTMGMGWVLKVGDLVLRDANIVTL